MKKISDDDLLNQIRNFYKKNTKITKKLFDADKTVCHSVTIINRFGTWNTAIEKSGLVIEKKEKKEKIKKEEPTLEEKKEKIRNQVREFINRTGKLPVNSDYISWNGLPSLTYVNKLFGNKNKLYVELGHTGKKFGEQLSKEQVIEKIKNFYKRTGREPLQNEFRIENDLPTLPDIKRYFKGKTEAKIEAGFKLAMKSKVYTKKEAIEALKAFYEREKRYPLKVDMKAENGLPPIIKLRSLFGTLREARAAAGMEVFGKKKTYLVKDDLEELLVKKYKEKGGRLTSAEIYIDKDLPNPSGVLNALRIQKLTDMWKYIEKKYKLTKK